MLWGPDVSVIPLSSTRGFYTIYDGFTLRVNVPTSQAPPSSDTTRPPLLHNPTVSSPLCTRPGTFLSSSTGPVVPSRGVRPQCRARLRVSTVSSNKRTFDALSRIPVRDSRFHLYPNTLLLTPRPLGPPTTLSVPGPT